MELVFDAAALIYVVEDLQSIAILRELHLKNGKVLIPRAIFDEFSVKPRDPTTPVSLLSFVIENPKPEDEIAIRKPGPLSHQDQVVLSIAHRRAATLVTEDNALAKAAARLEVQVLGLLQLLDHSVRHDCIAESAGRSLRAKAKQILAD